MRQAQETTPTPRSGTVLFGTDFGGWGGGEQVLLAHICGLSERGWKVEMLAPAGEIGRRARARGIAVREWPAAGRRGALRKCLRAIKPDVCHVVSYGADTRALVSVAHHAGVPVVISVSALHFPSGMRSRLYVRRAAAVTAASDTVARQLHASRVRTRHVETLMDIPVGAVRHCPQRMPFGRLAGDGVTVGWVGRFDPVKRLEDAIDAFAAFREANPGSRLRLAVGSTSYGDVSADDYERSVRRRIEELGLESDVEVRHDVADVFAFLDEVDIFLGTSERETFSRTTFEAMIMARPIVSTRAGAVCDLVREGREGVLVDVCDVHGLAAAMTSLNRNRDEALEMAKAARERALVLGRGHDAIGQLESLYRGAMRGSVGRLSVGGDDENVGMGRRTGDGGGPTPVS